jgi:hypothetical protein
MIGRVIDEAIRAQRQDIDRGGDIESVLVEREIEESPRRGARSTTEVTAIHRQRRGFAGLDDAREHAFKLGAIADDQSIGQTAAIGQVVYGHEIIAVIRGDEIEKGIAAVIVAVVAKRFALRGREDQVRVERGIEFRRLTADREALAFRGRETIYIVAVAVGLAVDRDIHTDLLRRRRVIVRLLLGDIDESPRHGKQARVTDSETTDNADIVSARRYVGRDIHLEATFLEKRCLEAGMIEKKRLDLFKVCSADVEFNRGPRPASEGKNAI